MPPKVHSSPLPYRALPPVPRRQSNWDSPTDFAAWCWVGMVVTVLLRLLVMLG